MKMRVILIAVFFIRLAISSLVSVVVPDSQIGNVYGQAGSPETSSTPPRLTVLKSDKFVTESSRIGPVSGDVAEYKIHVSVGSEEYDHITLTNYVQEKNPWHINTNKNLLILPGQGLTEKFYSDMAIYYAQCGYSVYILDRRETNISPDEPPLDENNLSFMKDWTIEAHLKDAHKCIKASRNQTSLLSGKSAESIEVTAIGHSHGALILTAYEASEYDDLPLGSVDRMVLIDIIIKYDPEYSELIQNQKQEFKLISDSIKSGVYYGTGMAAMMQVASLAYADPDGISPLNSELTNIQLFRLIASQTYSISPYPYTPDYHYWSGDLNGLYYVNESRLLYLTLKGGAVPFTPIYMDQYMAGLMGNVEGYEIDSTKVDSPVLYVGLGGGFGDYGSWWYEDEVGKTNRKVTCINWKDQGHASLLIDNNSSDLWELIYDWMKTEKPE
jgi:alpha-beta hydrolase superfamily lysophospholipase